MARFGRPTNSVAEAGRGELNLVLVARGTGRGYGFPPHLSVHWTPAVVEVGSGLRDDASKRERERERERYNFMIK